MSFGVVGVGMFRLNKGVETRYRGEAIWPSMVKQTIGMRDIQSNLFLFVVITL